MTVNESQFNIASMVMMNVLIAVAINNKIDTAIDEVEVTLLKHRIDEMENSLTSFHYALDSFNPFKTRKGEILVENENREQPPKVIQ